MSKRSEDVLGNISSCPAKRAKFESKHVAMQSKLVSAKEGFASYDDIWGEDFAEEDMEQIDLIASQAYLESKDALCHLNTRNTNKAIESIDPSPSSSRLPCNPKSNSPYTFESMKNICKETVLNFPSSSIHDTCSKSYTAFEQRLLNKGIHNSTFHFGKDVTIPDDADTKEFERLKAENEKLLSKFATKEGENVFLRQQLRQTQLRAENDKLERTRFVEEQAAQHRAEITHLCKEKEALKTQLELQAFEAANLMKRCKLIETAHISFAEPQRDLNYSVNRRKSSIGKLTEQREVDAQTDQSDEAIFHLRTTNAYYPLAKVPKVAFSTSCGEKPIVDIKMTEKTGKRNLPILQEEDTFRIFENPDLVKPVITKVDKKKLTIEFILPELAALQSKTTKELVSENCRFMINKIVSATRELMLSGIVVLQTIYHAMKNDDIRDMDDLYFSNVYAVISDSSKSVCDPQPWHENERALEARRLLGTLGYIASESIYLSDYVAGRRKLCTMDDHGYKTYSSQMTRYKAWPKAGCNFEMLEIILDFVSLIGLVRRSHQFSGLLVAIGNILCNVERKVSFCEKGTEYVARIFRQIVFSRPLPHCFASLSELMMTFIERENYASSLCTDSRSSTVMNWNQAACFTPDACVLEIFIVQLENSRFDRESAISIAYAITTSTQTILHGNSVSMRTDSSRSCCCCTKLVRFAVNVMCHCAKLNLNSCIMEESVQRIGRCNEQTCNERCKYLRWKQLCILREGIKCLCHLTTRDPDFLTRLPDVTDSFHLFMRYVDTFNELTLHELEREALQKIKSIAVFKASRSDSQPCPKKKVISTLFDIKESFLKIDAPTSTKMWQVESNRVESDVLLEKLVVFEALYNDIK